MTEARPPIWDDNAHNHLATPDSPASLSPRGHVRQSGLWVPQISSDVMKAEQHRLFKLLGGVDTYQYKGRVSKLLGMMLEASLPKVKIGDLCFVETMDGSMKAAEVVAFRGEKAQLILLYSADGIFQGSWVFSTGETTQIPVGDFLLGRLVSPLGEPMDGMPIDTRDANYVNIQAPPPDPLDRPIIDQKFETGVRAIDSLLTMGNGQRMGLFAGSGVGKSTLLGMIARESEADVNVMALIGERGREVKEFMEESLGEKGMKRSVLVCATGDQPPLLRMKALQSATAVAEYFRGQGKKVFLMTDTVTRCAMSGREVGLSIGEPPTMKGYPPSIFSWLQVVLERAGRTKQGSITALYTTLMEGDDINDPVVDTVRGIVDGHVFLSRKVAAQNHYPAIDVLGSVSRVFTAVADEEHQVAAGKMRELMAIYKDAKDLIDIGAYEHGASPKIDKAIEMMPDINKFLRQRITEPMRMEQTLEILKDMMRNVEF